MRRILTATKSGLEGSSRAMTRPVWRPAPANW
jgi:hypothetical protein